MSEGGPLFGYAQPLDDVASVAVADLRQWADIDERTLANQYPGHVLPEHIQRELDGHDTSTAVGALRRWAAVKHHLRVWNEGLERREAASQEEAQAAAYSLLRREPVYVTLSSGREVPVTDRSISAMTEIAAHQMRVKLLDADCNALASLFERLSPRGLRQRVSRKRRRLMARVATLYERAYTAREMHRAQMYAHVFTDSGAPAGPNDPPPSWWREITTEDDAAIIGALIEAGPLRARKLGQRPEAKKQKGEPAEDWGYEGVMVAWGIRKKVEPARALDQGLGQAIAEMRLAAPPTLEEEIDG